MPVDVRSSSLARIAALLCLFALKDFPKVGLDGECPKESSSARAYYGSCLPQQPCQRLRAREDDAHFRPASSRGERLIGGLRE